MDATSFAEHAPGDHYFRLEQYTIATLTDVVIRQHAVPGFYADPDLLRYIDALALQLNEGVFTAGAPVQGFPAVTVQQQEHQLYLGCACQSTLGRLCEHEAIVLTAIIRKEALGLFFNTSLRQRRLQQEAIPYGLEAAPELDRFFELIWSRQKISIIPRLTSLLPVTPASLSAIADTLYEGTVPAQAAMADKDNRIIIVLRPHKYYKYLVAELYQTTYTREGKPKNPLAIIDPLSLVWSSDEARFLKFYAAVSQMQRHSDGKRSKADIKALKAVIDNPGRFDCYGHTQDGTDQVTVALLTKMEPALLPAAAIQLCVRRKGDFYELVAYCSLDRTALPLQELELVYTYFLKSGNRIYLVEQPEVLGMIGLLKQHGGQVLIHAGRYREFKLRILDPLADRIFIDYQYIEPATPAQLKEQGFGTVTDKILYLSDSGNHILLTPVMRYHDVEIPIRSKRQIYAADDKGNEFLVQRNDTAEIDFTALLIRQQETLPEQLDNDLPYFYLHKQVFLDEHWFLNVFDEWRSNGIVILGFNELEGNKLNEHKAKIDVQVRTGINWFNVQARVQFGKKKVPLKTLYKAIRNRNRYIPLDDGTSGILPEEWIDKFAAYFNAGDITGEEIIQIPHINYTAVSQLYDETMLDEAATNVLYRYTRQLAGFEGINAIPVPQGLQATLRPYQQEGLNWLNFLDDLNFGGCLADDMGLGKSIQIIAFMLSQREKIGPNTNLLVVPATLIFNWQAEITRFAPSVKVLTVYGSDRQKHTRNFDDYDLVLTSYGALLSDISFLSRYSFNYIFLDESQNIKNPQTQRYKAVRLLQSRNKIAITGTPVENNTFDLFGQLSFACPGLLGNRQYFKDIYASPVEIFKNTKRLDELRQKVRPFILRRTKEQVATDLPEKTEMVLYCAMGAQQRKVYDAHEKEFREYISATTGDELSKRATNVLKGLTRLRQICNAPALLGLSGQAYDESAKLELLVAQIEEKSPGHKILVFSQFVSMLWLVAKELDARSIGYTTLTGSTRNREAVVREFQENAACRVFLVSLKAGGTGLNLTAADYVYLVDPWWNPAVENQAIDRAHRIGQDKKVIAVRLICQDTVEEKIMKLQGDKRTLSDDLVQAAGNKLPVLDKAYLVQLLALPQ